MAEQPAQKAEKKRTVYKPGKLLDWPEEIMDRANYGYKWRSQEQLGALSDGYDPKGWELAPDKTGKPVKRGDLILARMPIDMYKAMKEHKDQVRQSQTRLLLEKQAAEFDRESHEFRKAGGKIKFNFTQE